MRSATIREIDAAHAAHELLEIGDRVRSYDFEPMAGRPVRYVEGYIVDKLPDGRFEIVVDVDTMRPEKIRRVVRVPLQLFIGEWLGRITVVAPREAAERDAWMMNGCEIFRRYGYSPNDRELWIQSEGTLSILGHGEVLAAIARSEGWVRS